MKEPRRSGPGPGGPLGLHDWLRALPWLALFEVLHLLPYFFAPGGPAAKYVWDEHCVSHLYPAWSFSRDSVWQGVAPLWSPFNGCGHPALANVEDEVLHPLILINYLLPFPLGAGLMIAARFLIGLTGTFALARSLRASRPAALMAAGLYVFSGFIALNANGIITGAFFMPWILFWFHRLALAPRATSFLAAALFFALALLGGNPQIPFLAAAMALGLHLAVLAGKGRAFPIGRSLILPAAAIGLGALVSAGQLVPFIEYLDRSFTHHLPGFGRLHQDSRSYLGIILPVWNPAIVLTHSDLLETPIRELVELRFPPRSSADAMVPFPPEYLGLAASFFLVLGAIRLRRLPLEAVFFLGVAASSLGLIFGLFPFSLIAHAPPFDRMSNWRFTALPLALSSSMLAALLATRLPNTPRRSIVAALAALGAIAALGMALVASRAGLPLDHLLILGPTLAGAGLLLVFGALMTLAPRPQWIAVFALVELLGLDNLFNRPLFPHPHRALRDPQPILECARPDPQFRFIAYGDLIHPNLGALIGLNDFRVYDMIPPRDHVAFAEAANDWDHLDTIAYYLEHYYFNLEARGLDSNAPALASVRWALAPDYLSAGAPDLEFRAWAEERSTGPGQVQPVEATIDGVTLKALFMHAPSRVAFASEGGETASDRVAGRAALAPWAWRRELGDGVTMQALGRPGGRFRLLYSRYLDPRGRLEDRRWIPLEAPAGALIDPVLVVTPGPRGDDRSDFALWADLHDPQPRQDLARRWRLLSEGPIKCYENLEARPRLRVAEGVEVARDREESLAGIRTRRWPERAEVVVDDAGGSWPAAGGRVDSVEWGTDRVTAEVEMEGEGTLILADLYYPGWRAWVGGAEVRIHRANGSFRAVRMAPGRHRVEFRFVPVTVRIGWFAAAPAGLILLGLWRRGGLGRRGGRISAQRSSPD